MAVKRHLLDDAMENTRNNNDHSYRFCCDTHYRKTWKEKDDEFWVNMAICMWISANSYWMCCEFFKHEEIKNYAGIPFMLGMAAVLIFYIKRYNNKSKTDFL